MIKYAVLTNHFRLMSYYSRSSDLTGFGYRNFEDQKGRFSMNTMDRPLKVALLIAIAGVAVLLLGCPMAKVATPSFDPVDGSDLSSGGPLFTETISCETDGVSIYYTVDGTTPTEASTEYTGPFEFSVSHIPPEIVKAIAVKAGMEDSEVGAATYTWDW